jgi:NAD(P)H-dependent flavin oxidoreductase YrpB (nitropropane dioxygenase family)
VSSEGGLGVIASVGLGEDEASEESYEERSRDALRNEIREVKQRHLPVGVNIMVVLTNYRSLVQVCVEEAVDVIISGAGLPLRLPEYAVGSDAGLVPIVSSARAARIVCKTWLRRYDRLPDAFIVEGPMAGGHLGFSFDELTEGKAQPLETLLKGVLAVAGEYQEHYGKPMPVIAAGGIYTGRDIADFLTMGASGVQMGTRFVATHECDASDRYKEAFVTARREDVIVIRSPVGMPARVIKNEFIERSLKGRKFTFACLYKCLLSCEVITANYCIAESLLNAARGNFDHGFAMCGQNVYRIDKIVTVKALVQELVEEAEQHLG